MRLLHRGPSPDGPFAPVHEGLIAAQGSPTEGAAYRVLDDGAGWGPPPWYRLEDVDIHGISAFHPVVMTEGWPIHWRLRPWLPASISTARFVSLPKPA